ncbi:N-acetyltransferase B complex, non-catalytic subunit [Dillenia turbinata]|uniref:Laccase n=1 Tax=Dillenia turbinata TaxID=194707 RepID=A0AAN8Z9C9_9MAGN
MKFGMAGGIPERRVRPIWDAIDSRQFKNALKQSTTLLAKFPNSPYALVSLPSPLRFFRMFRLLLATVCSQLAMLLLLIVLVDYGNLLSPSAPAPCNGVISGALPNLGLRACVSSELRGDLLLCSLSFYTTQALKALILERMGKPEEALSVCLDAKEQLYNNDSVLIDDLTLSTLQIVFQRLDRLDLATSCYEYACGRYPNNLELMMGLFNSYVREYSFVKQQQTAIKMYKIAGEERFLLWAVCSVQLQVFCGNGGEKLLTLAEGLLKKHVASHSLHEPEALMVYISILEQQSKYGDALELLSGKLGSLLMIEVDKLRIQGRLLAQAGDYAAAANIYQKVLESCPDDWECFLHYLGCLLEDGSCWQDECTNEYIHPPEIVDCKLTNLSDNLLDSRISVASAFVQKLQKKPNSDFIRCPYLAELEIERRKCLYSRGSDDKLMEDLVQYFYRFGHLSCFPADVEVFFQALSPDKRTEFIDKVMNCSDHAISPTKVLGRSMSLLKLQEMLGDMFKRPVGELEALAVQMVDLYCKSLPLSKDLDPQENMHGEELLSMACNVLVQLYWRTRHLGYLLEAIMILEFGLSVRRHISNYKILLLHLYSHLGALSLAHEWYKSLEVKNILLETVSHHIVPQMLVSPLWANLNDLLKDYLKFMDDHSRESADLTFLAYRHRNYSKVIEFVQFKGRLEHSNQYLMARIEAPILQLKQNADNIEEEESILENMNYGVGIVELATDIGCTRLTFNEDLQLRPWWTPTSDKHYLLEPFQEGSYCSKRKLQQHMEEYRANVQKVVEKRSLVPRLIYLSIQCASMSVKENAEANGLSNTKIASEMRTLLDRYAKLLGFSLDEAIEVIAGVLNGQNSSKAFELDLINWLNFAVFLNAGNLASYDLGPPNKDGSTSNLWKVVDSLLQKYVLEKFRRMGSLTCSPGSDFLMLVQLVVEPLAWHGLIIQSCLRSSLPSGKRKKKAGPAEISNSLLSHAANDSVQSLCSILEEVERWLRQKISEPEDEKLESFLSCQQGLENGPGRIYQIVDSLISSTTSTDVGDRIFQALKAWDPVQIARKFVAGQRTSLSKFLQICESKSKLFQTLKQQLQLIRQQCLSISCFPLQCRGMDTYNYTDRLGWIFLCISVFLAFIVCSADAETQYHDFIIRSKPVKRLCRTHDIITVNGQFPGPTLEVHNGDTLVIKVQNNARYNITLHWHGIRQMRTPWADGPEYVTQCPIQPGGSYTYRFTIQDQEGTLWWHAHSSWLRATVYGALIIHPKSGFPYPFTKPKREIAILLGEWWDRNPIDVLRQATITGAAPNVSDAFTINGQPGDLYRCSRKDTTKIPVLSGETVLLRVINAALNQPLFFAVANHKLTVVGADAAYTKPFTTKILMLGPGQTTNVLLTADQPPAEYYMAARAYASAQGAPFDNTTTTAIIQCKRAPHNTKKGTSSAPILPRLPAYNDTATVTAFTSRFKSPSKVKVPTQIDENLFFTIGLGLFNCSRPSPRCQGPNGTRFTASMNNVSLVLPSNNSILQAYYQRTPGVYTTDFPPVPPVQFDYTGNVSRALWQPIKGTKLYKLKYGSRVQVVLQGTNIFTAEDHPMHLHGYHIYVVAQGFGNFDPRKDRAKFNLIDPPLRNTIDVPVGGWAVIRFVADNPGVWLMHCHLDVHITWGLAMAFLVENGVGESESIEPPPADLPVC